MEATDNFYFKASKKSINNITHQGILEKPFGALSRFIKTKPFLTQ
jgi:hypothetical protein